MVDRLQNDEIRPLVAADTSSYRRFLAGEHGADVAAIDEALSTESLHFPPVVATELMSDPHLEAKALAMIADVPMLDLYAGFWYRAGMLRAALLRQGFKAAVSDCLIAQSCIDHNVPLITHDRDFRHFVRAGLKLL
jgi:predicted nucleic acid-binding protein